LKQTSPLPILVIGHDGPNGKALRKQHSDSHLEYIKKVHPMICVAGPMRQGKHAIEDKEYDSSFFIYDTDDVAIAHKLLKNDPFAKGGVFEHVSFAEIEPDAGRWIGGIPPK
jgi:uncharacterized protein YciI